MISSWRKWNLEDVNKFFTVESRQKDKNTFLKTHLTIDKIKIDFCRNSNFESSTFIGENDLLNFLKEVYVNTENRIFFIVGETGCGKSELCQWLEYSLLESNNLVPIHISRRTTHVSEIARILSYHLPKDSEFIYTGSSINLNSIPVETLSEYLSSSSAIKLAFHPNIPENQRIILSQLISDRKFKTYITEQILKYNLIYQNYEVDRNNVDILPKNDYQILVTNILADLEKEIPYNHYNLVREWILVSIRDLLQINNLNQVLEQVSMYYKTQNKRPVLILEDITSFGFLRDDLFDYLFDLTSGNFDAIIGLTSGFEKTQLNNLLSEDDLTYMYERLSGRFILTGENGDTFFLNGEGPIKLVKKYLDAIKKDVPEDWEKASNYLYPLNDALINKLYSHLVEEGNIKQTPRLLLNFVLKGLLTSDDKPFKYLSKQNPYLLSPTNHFRINNIQNSDLSQLILWYGKQEDKKIVLNKSLSDIWEIEVSENLIDQDLNEINIPRLLIETVSPNHFAKPVDIVTQEVWEVSLGELQKWIVNNERYPSREYLKRGIEQLSDNFNDCRKISNKDCIAVTSDYLIYTRSKEHLPIYLDSNSGDSESKEGIVQFNLKKDETDRFLLEETLLYYWKSNVDLDGFSNPVKTIDWIENNLNLFNQDINILLEKKLSGITWKEIVLTSYGLIRNFVLGSNINNKEEFIKRFPFDFKLDSTFNSPWFTENKNNSFYQLQKWEKPLVDKWKVYQELITGLFYIRDSFIDRDLYEETIEEYNIDEIIDRITSINIKELKTLSFRASRNSFSLFELIEPLYNYCIGLKKVDITEKFDLLVYRLNKIEKDLVSQKNISISDIVLSINKLKKYYGKLNISWPIKFEKFNSLIEVLDLDNLNNLLEEVRSVVSDYSLLSSKNPLSFVSLFRKYSKIVEHPFIQIYLIIEEACETIEKTSEKEKKSSKNKKVSFTNPYKKLKSNLIELQGVLNELSRKS